MPISVHVTLLSGRSASILCQPSSSVNELRLRAQEQLQTDISALFSRTGQQLIGRQSLKEALPLCGEDGEEDDVAVTAALRQTVVTSSWESLLSSGDAWPLASSWATDAFAAIRPDGLVVTWGYGFSGGDSSLVQAQLDDVQKICACKGSFAAIRSDGTVVTWGHEASGGDSSLVQEQLKGVQEIRASRSAFAAIRADGKVVAWGYGDQCGDSTEVQEQLKGVWEVRSSAGAFAAILENGRVVTWGDSCYGGDSSKVQGLLKNVTDIRATLASFAALRSDRRDRKSVV